MLVLHETSLQIYIDLLYAEKEKSNAKVWITKMDLKHWTLWQLCHKCLSKKKTKTKPPKSWHSSIILELTAWRHEEGQNDQERTCRYKTSKHNQHYKIFGKETRKHREKKKKKKVSRMMGEPGKDKPKRNTRKVQASFLVIL